MNLMKIKLKTKRLLLVPINYSYAEDIFKYLRYPVDKRNHASRKIPEYNGGIIKKI